MAKKKKKVRVDLRKNRSKPARDRQWTQNYKEHGYEEEATLSDERVRARGDLSRKRTIMQETDESESAESSDMPAVDDEECLSGRVLRVHGLLSVVETESGEQYSCMVRRLLRSLITDERNIVTTGDQVWFRPAANNEGMIERVEPRHGVLRRESKGREHVLVANIDQVVFVMSLREPDLKPHLIDRYLCTAEHCEIKPILCLNKADLIEPCEVQNIIGMYSQLGITTLLTSAVSGMGVDRLRDLLKDRQSVFSGQSGVGKSSLLNVVEPELGLRVREISDVNQKGRHTTTTSELIRLSFGGWVADTPGIRQFELWDVLSMEVEGLFPELRPHVAFCAFPDCTHTHEDNCAVKRAVERRQISPTRYHSYLGILSGKMED